MFKSILPWLVALPLLGLWACSKEDAPDPAAAAATQNLADIKAYIAARPALSAAKTSASGLSYLVTTSPASTTKSPGLGEEVSFTYRSYNLKDVLVDSVYATKPVYFPFGLGLLLGGLEEGLSYMREGDKATLLIPSFLGYDSRSLTNLPAYSAVRFEVSMLRSLTENQQISRYLTANKLTLTDSSSTGLKIIKTTSNPTGNALVTGQTVTLGYKGYLLRNSTPFDSTTAAKPFDVTLGTSQVIAGFEEGIRKLRVGEKATIIIPSAIGYGTKGATNNNNQYVVPPYAPIIFKLEVLAIK
jgi:FKBP-type peptidyl-prolyl cis-trans isomerase